MADYSMVQECTDRYNVQDTPAGGLEIQITVPRRFRDLWLAKLSELRTTDAEIRLFESPERGA